MPTNSVICSTGLASSVTISTPMAGIPPPAAAAAAAGRALAAAARQQAASNSKVTRKKRFRGLFICL